jgi:hypothetical protein
LKRSGYVAHVSLELIILMSPPSKYWDYNHVPPCLALIFSYMWKLFNKMFSLYFFNYFILWCVGYSVAFTKLLTIYQIYYTWIHPLHHSSLSSLFPFLE